MITLHLITTKFRMQMVYILRSGTKMIGLASLLLQSGIVGE